MNPMDTVDTITAIDEQLGLASAATDREVVLTRLVDAPRALVWKVWTEPEHIVRWWGPKGFEITDCAVDLRVGGRFRLLMQGADGAIHPCRGIFREIVKPERIVYDGEPDDRHGCGAGLPPSARVTVTFDNEGGGTRVTVRTRFITDEACRAAHDAGYLTGWGESLARVAGHAQQLALRQDTPPDGAGDQGVGDGGPDAFDDEEEIEALMAAWSRALEAKDVDGLTAAYADDAVLFDLKPPFRVQGVAAIRQIWEACLPCLPDRFASERRDVSITVAGDGAVAHGLHRIRPLDGDNPACTWIRVTVCYRRLDGDWRVVHEHVSIPFDPETGQVAFITDDGNG